MAGAGTIGVGGAGSGVGVGGWQLYEHVINPTTHRQLTNQGYKWNPAKVPAGDSVPSDSKKFDWKKWDSCTKKLFSNNLTIKHEDSSSSSTAQEIRKTDATSTNVSQSIYFEKPSKVSENFIACALFDLRGDDDGSISKIYFKSEVAVRDENHGWIMWSGLSNTPGNNSGTVTLEYRLLLLKKTNGNWEIDKGFGWSGPSTGTESEGSSNEVLDQLHVILPTGSWQTFRAENGYSRRRIWSGIAKVDKSSSKHLVQSLDIHMDKKEDMNKKDEERSKSRGFWGVSNGKWVLSGAGYDKVNRMYEKDKGWTTLSQTIDLGETLTQWYAPYKGDGNQNNPPNVKWMTCDQWSGNRGTYSPEDSWNKTMQEMCYTK